MHSSYQKHNKVFISYAKWFDMWQYDDRFLVPSELPVAIDEFCEEEFGYKPIKYTTYNDGMSYICYCLDSPDDATLFKLTWC